MSRRGALAALLLACAGGAAAQVVTPYRSGASGEALVLNAELTVRTARAATSTSVKPRPGDTWSALAALGLGRPAPRRWPPGTLLARVSSRRDPPAGLDAVGRAVAPPCASLPGDRLEGDAWVHHARAATLPTYGEGLWQVAAWFTGDARRWSDLAQANALPGPELSPEQMVRIPAALLHPAFAARPSSADGTLEYGRDREGRYAGYRLKAGEALYSAVVLRYTGRTSSEDVHAVLETVQRRSGIASATDIPVGWLVKVPLALLEPEFLPQDDPAHREQVAASREREEALEQQPVPRAGRGLEGVLVVLDAGHGGRDLGTMSHGLWEHDYVYDLTCRLKRWLETKTRARVALTLEDLESGTAPSDADPLVANQQGTVRTNPPFLAREVGEAPMGVNLRWYRPTPPPGSRTEGTAADRVVFPLAPRRRAPPRAASGAMVYVPGAR
jgi:N-acetylmuramoyl-L-alanine amidase